MRNKIQNIHEKGGQLKMI